MKTMLGDLVPGQTMKGIKMGFLSSLASMGTMGLGGIGSSINNMTGASSSAAQAQRYAVTNAKLNNKFQKEFAQNAHQWEMADLKAAGLNPALTATGGSGASASGGGSFGGSTGTPAGNPFDILNSIVGLQNQTSATKSQNAVNYASAIKAITEAKWMPTNMKINAFNAISQRMTAEASATNAETNEGTGVRKRVKKLIDGLDEPYQEPTEQEKKEGHLF